MQISVEVCMPRTVGIALLIAAVVVHAGCGGSNQQPAQSAQSAVSRNVVSVAPTTEVAGAQDLVVTITGFNFDNHPHNLSTAVWSLNGVTSLLDTQFVSPQELRAVVPSALLIAPVIAQIFVQTGDPTGDAPPARTEGTRFRVSPPQPDVVTIFSISPPSTTAGSDDLTVTITGANFTGDAHKSNVAVWSPVKGNSTSLTATFESSSKLTLVIPAQLLTNRTLAYLHVEIWKNAPVEMPDSTSNSLSFVVN
jgi:hypothetical protein